MDRSAIIAFFKDKAHAYTNGKMVSVARLFDVPCKLMIGTRSLDITRHSEIESIFTNYRDALLEKDFAETRSDVLHLSQADDETTLCLVKYTNLDRSGGVISEEATSYFVRKSDNGLMHIVSAEFVDEQSPNLFDGIEKTDSDAQTKS
ncbi:MAG: hypothetical protein AAGA08_17375 [Pseudomonadota bacterium]